MFEYNKANFVVNDSDLDDPNTFKLVYTGSVRKVNNLGLLLDVAKKVQNPRIKLLIWGGGDELPMLEERIQSEQISNVVLKGHVDKKYIPSIVSRADVNIAHNTPTSLFNYGISFNKLFDYLAAGKPILCDFSCQYNPAVLAGAAMTVDRTDAASIASLIEGMAKLDINEYNKLCQNAKKCAKEYEYKNLALKLVKVVENC